MCVLTLFILLIYPKHQMLFIASKKNAHWFSRACCNARTCWHSDTLNLRVRIPITDGGPESDHTRCLTPHIFFQVVIDDVIAILLLCRIEFLTIELYPRVGASTCRLNCLRKPLTDIQHQLILQVKLIKAPCKAAYYIFNVSHYEWYLQ